MTCHEKSRRVMIGHDRVMTSHDLGHDASVVKRHNARHDLGMTRHEQS